MVVLVLQFVEGGKNRALNSDGVHWEFPCTFAQAVIHDIRDRLLEKH